MYNLSFIQCAALLETKLINQLINHFRYLSPQCGRASVRNNVRGAAFKRRFSHLVDHPKCFTTQAYILSVHSQRLQTLFTLIRPEFGLTFLLEDTLAYQLQGTKPPTFYVHEQQLGLANVEEKNLNEAASRISENVPRHFPE